MSAIDDRPASSTSASAAAASTTSSIPLSPSVIFNSTPGVPRAHPKSSNPTNPIVFFDIAIGGSDAGRVIIELFAAECPRTAENFRQFCTGEFLSSGADKESIGYKNSLIHRIQPDFILQGGDFTHGDGSGGKISIYGGIDSLFDDESAGLSIVPNRPGLLAMHNTGSNTNGSQFIILLNSAPWLKGKNVIFGAIIDGMMTIRKIEAVPLIPGTEKPKLEVKITQCGEM